MKGSISRIFALLMQYQMQRGLLGVSILEFQICKTSLRLLHDWSDCIGFEVRLYSFSIEIVLLVLYIYYVYLISPIRFALSTFKFDESKAVCSTVARFSPAFRTASFDRVARVGTLAHHHGFPRATKFFFLNYWFGAIRWRSASF